VSELGVGEPARDCLVCREVACEVELPGGFLLDEEYLIAFHLFPQQGAEEIYLGWLVVAARRHAPGFEDLEDKEAAAVGVSISRLSRALRNVGADHVFAARIGTGEPHLHVHLLPRYPETPRDLPWHSVDEWEGARRGGTAEVTAFVNQLREHL